MEMINMFDEGMALRDGECLNISCLKRVRNDADPDDIIPRFHYHKYIEIIYMTEGIVDTYINNEIHTITPGDLILIYPLEPHFTKFVTPSKFTVICALPDILTTTDQTYNEFEYVFNMTKNSKPRCRVISDVPEFEELTDDAYEKFKENEYCSELMVRADTIKIFAHILKHWKKTNSIIPIQSNITKNCLSIVNKLINHIKNPENASMKTHDAAVMCSMSDGYFSRIFKQITGMTFIEYTKSVKISEAERLLKCTDESITNISQALNYSTSSHFIEDFKRQKGVSPKKFRKGFDKTGQRI